MYKLLFNKRAQRALGRSPEEKVEGDTVEPIIENPRGII